MGFQAHWGVWNSYSSCTKLKSDGRNEIYKLNWPRKHHYLPKCIHATRDNRFQKTAFFSSFFLSFFLSFFFIHSTSPHTKASKYSRDTQNWSLGISGVPFDSLNMIRDDICSRRSGRWSSTPAWRAPCLIYVGRETERECPDVLYIRVDVRSSRACPRCRRTVKLRR